MSTVTVLSFSDPEGADKALAIVRGLQKQRLITVQDAAVVSWPIGKKRPTTQQSVDLVRAGAVSGVFWGLLFGLIFVAPLIGMSIGAAFGALSGALRDYGIDDEFIKLVRERVQEGTSALFLMTSGAVLDRVADAFTSVHFEIMSTNLSKEQEQRLRDTFDEAA